jgi:CheY-like chemotaxis protein
MIPKILVVEDEAIIRFTIADDIRDAGFEVFEARDAEEALSLLRRHDDIGVLFTDVDMPGEMDGLGLSATVRAQWPDVRIIVTSGKQVPLRGILPGDSRFMPKPYSSDTVLQTIRQMLE